jgi:hypothetical protein
MQGIEPLVELLGDDADAIQEYTDAKQGDLFSVLTRARNKLLVYITGLQPVSFPNLFRAEVVVAVRIASLDPGVLFQTMFASPSTASGADGLPFYASEIHPDWEPMDLPSMVRKSIPVTEESDLDFWEIRFAFRSKRT